MNHRNVYERRERVRTVLTVKGGTGRKGSSMRRVLWLLSIVMIAAAALIGPVAAQEGVALG